MKKRIFLISLLHLSVSYGATPPIKKENPSIKTKKLELLLGMYKIIKLDFSPHTLINVSNEDVLDYQLIPQKRQIIFKGLKVGESEVLIYDTVNEMRARYLVKLIQTDQSKVIKNLTELLGDIEGIEIGIKGENVYIGGKIIVPGDVGRIVLILKKYPGVLPLVELAPQSQLAIAKKMQEEIQSQNLKDVTVRVVNHLFWLEGMATSGDAKSRAEKIAQIYVPDQLENLARRMDSVQTAKRNIIQNFIQIVPAPAKPQGLPKLLKIKAQFVELSKDYSKIFGFKWNPILTGSGGAITFGKTQDGSISTRRSPNTLSGVISNLFPKLASAKSAGYARIVRSGVLVLNEKETGSITKTANKQFALGTGDFTKAENAESGFTLNINKPQVLPKDNIKLTISLTVSTTIGGSPQVETLKNSINTTLIIKSKESAVIGGIFSDKSATVYDRDPPGGIETPQSEESTSSIFSFIRSKSYSENKEQYVVFITPEIIKSASSGTNEIKKKFRKRRY